MQLSKLYDYLLNFGIFTRRIVFIVLLLGVLWIPGILALVAFPQTRIWGVKLIWWSIWLSAAWGGWWIALTLALTLPLIARFTIGVVAVTTRQYIAWLNALQRYITLFLWTLECWIAWQPLIITRQSPDSSESSHEIISLIAKLLFGIFLCAAVLLGEKFAIQVIAGKFHERSYAERIADQKKAINLLVILYRHSSDVGDPDILDDVAKPSKEAVRILKGTSKNVKGMGWSSSSVWGDLANEIAGGSLLQPNSPQAIVIDALSSANKTRLLARRLFYSFVKTGKKALYPLDIAGFFETQDEADEAFNLFDKDGNGDATRDEVEMV